ncbi:(2Fe-2S)-binding protein [Umezawaea sp. Da 62-37]|uniref:(2Fe-2S)-binding protein n=1 Tax=Umezawaea sp. Da 62-37 TaxID=3075927 RepID=UPI0028F70642|nr:(2Fe-2S)-binding protein [Umezawaea sp. Da 62-37]WNV91780.1 (2Fe-2S)-binding protein [Umezawaea sp. Da 62-37]
MTIPAEVRTRRASTPVAESITRVSTRSDDVEVRFGLPAQRGDWVLCSDALADPALFDRWRKALAEWLEVQYGGSSDRATAGYVMGWYLGVPGQLAGLLFHSARRVPSLRPADLAFRLAGDRPQVAGIALLSDEFACLPDDPAGNHPAATVVADEAALAALLRAKYVAHAADFVKAFGPTVRLGRRMLWAAATDALDKGTWLAGRMCGDESTGVSDAAMLLPERIAPLTSGSTMRFTDGEWTRSRQSCCFTYVLPGAEECDTCPRVCR